MLCLCRNSPVSGVVLSRVVAHIKRHRKTCCGPRMVYRWRCCCRCCVRIMYMMLSYPAMKSTSIHKKRDTDTVIYICIDSGSPHTVSVTVKKGANIHSFHFRKFTAKIWMTLDFLRCMSKPI